MIYKQAGDVFEKYSRESMVRSIKIECPCDDVMYEKVIARIANCNTNSHNIFSAFLKEKEAFNITA